MKILVLIILFLFVSHIFACKHSDCTTEEKPICNIFETDGSCVRCLVASHCNIDEYCTEAHNCRKYTKDDVLGKFCNDHAADSWTTCTEANEFNFCGKCDSTDDTVPLWKGVCIDWTCEPCRVGDQSSGIMSQHTNVQCYPRSAGNPAGTIKTEKNADFTPSYFIQTSFSIAMLFLGFLLLGILIMTILIMKRSTI
ncbi:hypothetical protein M0812_07131 [Anaeramoeba flamelloides]|uniref:Uncharacterized protein n=1 Tax=Anaeramoeba flamelloides TaxID=1746091 RepID=A0AAV8ABY0_9EUKA|nr:hypothetical protein M0812_07131 [Anaeramoeba flamelloides]